MTNKITSTPKQLNNVFRGNFPIIFLTTNEEGIITSLSDSWEKLTGYKTETSITQSLFEFVKFNHLNLGNPQELLEIHKNESFRESAILYTCEGQLLEIDINFTIGSSEIEILIYILSTVQEVKIEKDDTDLLNALVEGISAATGQQLFENFVLSLSKLIEADYVFVGEYSVENHSVKTLALSAEGKIADNIEYSLEYTPCEDVIDSEGCIYSQDVISLFPKDKLLEDMGIEGYIGVPLQNKTELPIGIIVALFKKPIENSNYLADVLKIFSGRASAELERIMIDKELKKKENTIRDERTFLRHLLDSIPDLIFIKDLEGKFILCNSAFEKLTGKKEHELKGLSDFDLYPEEIAHQFRTKDKAVINSANMSRSEEWGYYFDGRKVRLDTYKIPYYDYEGRSKGIIGISRNISDLIDTRLTLQRSEQLYKSAVTVLNEGVVVHDTKGKIISCNEAAEEILGLTFDQMRGVTSLDPRWNCVREDHSPFPGNEHPIAEVLEKKIPVRDVMMGVNKPDGIVTWITINAEPVFDTKTNELSSVVVSFTDITRFKLIQEALKDSELQYRSLFEMATDAILLTSGYTIEACNPRAIQILLHNQNKSLNGINFKEISSSNNKSHLLKVLDDFFTKSSNKDEIKLEWEFIRTDGTLLSTELSVNHIEINGQERFMLLIHDISERKRNEEAIKQQNKELQKANKELDSFVYRVSHDLRAPISSVLGLIQLMQDEDDLVKIRQYLGMQEQKMNRLDNFITDILDYSRNSRISISEDKVDIHSLCKETIEMNKFSDLAKDVDITLNINQNTDLICDKQRIQVILNNLISNGLRYQNSFQTTKKLHIEADVSNDELSVKVSDNGIGIDKEHIDNIFEMFYRATSNKPGSGLGLYIVKDTLDKLGGKIKVNSKLGDGATFTISIPNKNSIQ